MAENTNPAVTRCIGPREAGERAGVTRWTVIDWAERYPPLGHRVGGRWRINPDVLAQICRGEIQLTRRAMAAA